MTEQYSYESAVANASRHRYIHQYTTYAALEKIISNKTLRLSRIDHPNDRVENDRLVDLWKKKVYVSCFTHREHESFFFWNTYAKGCRDGIMISFLTGDLQELSIYPDEKCEEAPLEKCNKSDLNLDFSPAIDASSWGVFDYSVLDVVYCPRNVELSTLDHFQGRVKYSEWDMESETRIRVAIRPKCLEVCIDNGKAMYLTPENDYVYAKLPEACMESMIITLSPYAGKTLKRRVEELLNNNGLLGKIQIKDSVLTGEVNSPMYLY